MNGPAEDQSRIDAARRSAALRLAGRLRKAGWVRRTSTYEAFATVPRDRLISHVFRVGRGDDGTTTWSRLDRVDHRDQWIDITFEDQPLAVALDEGSGKPISSSTAPWLMACMVEALGVREGQKVLEVGTGTGYNAAILARLVGTRGRVVTVEVDPALASEAMRGLEAAGALTVTCHTGDGMRGWPDDAPYDRVEVTAGTEILSDAWLEQLRIGGRLVGCVQGLQSGALVTVVKHAEDHASGRFLEIPNIGFTHARGGGRSHTAEALFVAGIHPDAGRTVEAWHRHQVVEPVDLADLEFHSSFMFWLQFALPATLLVRSIGDDEALSLIDPIRGWTWKLRFDDPKVVDIRGQDAWWLQFASEYRDWLNHGRPGRGDFIYRWRGRDRHSVELRPRSQTRTLRRWALRPW